MTDTSLIIATRWETPFEEVDADRLHLLRVDYPSVSFLELADGRRFDFSEFVGPQDCDFWIFSEVDEIVYRVSADIQAIRITDECDFPLPSEWQCKPFVRSVRLMGSDMHQSTTGIVNGKKPSYAITTGWNCVEFLALNPPIIRAVSRVHAKLPQNLN